jgi:ATP adenylyltransferase/5',5'''-P-1,P-4-tetraphosphate phosphorylase II
LNVHDFEAALIAMKALSNNGKCMMYFNGGLYPYVSLNHKHLQVIPIDSLIYGKIPIEECIMEAMERA